MNPRILDNLRKLAGGKVRWDRLGKEEQQELLDLGMVRIEYETPEITPAGSQALKENP